MCTSLVMFTQILLRRCTFVVCLVCFLLCIVVVFFCFFIFFFFQAEDGIRDPLVTGVQTCALPIFLSQYLSSKGQDVCGIDADPVNQTFSEYGGLRVECLNLLREGSIDQREFDLRSEERRVGKECRSGWGWWYYKKKKKKYVVTDRI